MITRHRSLVLGGGVAAVLAGFASTGDAQTPGGTTLSLYEPGGAGSSFRIVDNVPHSPVKNPQSRKYRFSAGDELVFSNPVLDKKGGSTVATLYARATVLRGATFPTLRTISHVVLEFKDGSQLNAEGAFGFTQVARIAITGGTGKYLGARGSVVSKSSTTDESSQDTVTLLP